MDLVTPLKTEIGALRRDGKGRFLAVLAISWGLLTGTRMIYPILLPYLQESFNLSLTVAGLLVTTLWLSGALGQLPGGVLADKYNERTVMAAGTIVVALALLLVVTAPTALVLFAATVLWGIGHSQFPIARITFLTHTYPDRIGSALGVTMATGDIGQTLLPPIAGVIAAAIVWQAGFGFTIPLLLLFGVLLWWILPDQEPRETESEGFSMESVRYVYGELRRPTMTFMAFIMFLFIFIWQSFTAFYPTYLVVEKGLSASLAGVLFGSFFAVGVIVKPFAGAAYDRIGMRGALIGVLIGPVVGLALLPVVEGFWSIVAVTALVSTMLGSGAITQSFLAESFAEEVRGTGLGIVRTITATVGAGGPVVFGVLGDYGYFDQGYFALAIIMAGVILLTLRMPAR